MGSATSTNPTRAAAIRLAPAWCMALALLVCLTEASHAGNAVAVVVLPPQAVASLGDKGMAAAELLCDQLAARLGQDPNLRVVNRTQLDRVLSEKVLAGQPGPVLAYDAMLRVRVDPLRARPAVILEVIDLAAGNIVGVSEWPWAMETPPGKLREMAKACGDLIHKAPLAEAGTVKLRLLGVLAPGGMGRIEALRLHLEEMLAQTVAACPTVRVAHHLEALSAKEESLLLLMGHARLGGGRRFTPQADAVLEAQLGELDGEGKTFEDTTIEIRLRLGKGGDGQWKRVAGKVSDWAKIVPQACELLAGELGQARPQTAARQAAGMILRRAQAKAELQAAMKQKDKNGKPALDRVAAAVKLDPTYEPASYWLVECCTWQGGGTDTIREALRYLERFDQVPANRRRVTELAYYRAHESIPNGQETQMLRRIVEIGMGGDIDSYDAYCGWLVARVYYGMRAAGVSPAYRMEWLEQVRRRVDILSPQVGKIESFHRGNIDSSFLRVRYFLATFALDCGQGEAARERLREFMACRRSVARDSWQVAKVMMRETVVKIADEPLLAEYDRWLAELTTPVRQIELKWNDYPVYKKTAVGLIVKKFSGMLPLAAGPGGVYGVSGIGGYSELIGRSDRIPSAHRMVMVPTDETGRPTGKEQPLTMPEFNADIAVTGAAFLAGKLYVSTKRTGLLVRDANTGQWEQIGPKQGLVDWYVYHVHPLDDRTLLVIAGQKSRRVVYCTLDVLTGKTTLVQRIEGTHTGWSGAFSAPTSVWRSGDELMAMNYTGLARDILRKRPRFTSWPNAWPYGWKCRPHTFSCEPTSLAGIGDKLYVMSGTGLHEIDRAGKVLRSWWGRKFFYAGGPAPDNIARDSITTPGDLPGDNLRSEYKFVAATKDHLFLVGRNAELLCYDPASDTWSGPLRLASVGPEAYPLGTAEGVWVGGARGLACVRTADFIAAAKSAGRVMTSGKVRLLKSQLAEKAGPLAAAKFDLLRRDFDGARKRTEAILASTPNDPHALLLMAVINDFWCLNRPKEALRWYGKLADMESNFSAVYTGLYGVFRINYTLRQWEQAISAGELLLDKIPCLYGGMTSEVERFMEYARKNRDKAARKPRASARRAPTTQP